MSALWAVAAVANYHHALTMMSPDHPWRYLLAIAATSLDFIKAGAPLLIVAAIANRRWMSAMLTAMLFVLAALWSLQSVHGFVVSSFGERHGERQVSATQHETLLRRIEIEQKTLAFLAEQKTSTANGRSELTTSMAATRKSLDDLNKQLGNVKAIASADPVGEYVQKYYGLDPAKAKFWTVFILIGCIELGSMFGLYMLSGFFKTPAPPQPPSTKQVIENIPAAVHAAPLQGPPAVDPGPRIVVDNDKRPTPADMRQSLHERLGPSVPPQPPKPREISGADSVREWAQTSGSNEGEHSTLYATYVTWAGQQGLQAVSGGQFSSALRDLGWLSRRASRPTGSGQTTIYRAPQQTAEAA